MTIGAISMQNVSHGKGQAALTVRAAGSDGRVFAGDDAMLAAVAATVSAAGTPMAAVLPDGTIYAWNRGFERVSRISAGRVVNTLVQETFRTTGSVVLSEKLAAGEAFQVSVSDMVWNLAPMEAPASRCDWLVVEFSPVRVDGRLCAYVAAIGGADGIFNDRKDVHDFIQQISGVGDLYVDAVDMISERRQKMLIAEKLAGIGQLAAGVAHEINNPVGYVHSNLNALREYISDISCALQAFDEIEAMSGAGSPISCYINQLRQKTDIDYIRNDLPNIVAESMDGVDRVKKIIRALKDFSHIDDENFTPYDLHAGIDSTIRVADNEIKYRAQVIREYGELPVVECLPSQINQVMLNLVLNAAHSIKADGRIVIRTGCTEHTAWFEIEDNGMGIPPENISRLFEPFFTTKPIGQGTGLGLSLSYSIVRKHRGDITVQSEAGEGSLFRVSLPIRHDDRSVGEYERKEQEEQGRIL